MYREWGGRSLCCGTREGWTLGQAKVVAQVQGWEWLWVFSQGSAWSRGSKAVSGLLSTCKKYVN